MLLMRTVMRYWCLVLGVTLLIGGHAAAAHAEAVELICNRNSCKPVALEALFSPAIRWSPGMRQVRRVRVINSDTERPLQVALRIAHAPDASGSCQMDRYIMLGVETADSRSYRTLRQWEAEALVDVGDISAGQGVEFTVAAALDSSLPDACQGATTQMDVRLRITERGRTINQSLQKTQDGSVLGAFTRPTRTPVRSCATCYWWPLYALQIVLYGLYGLLLRRPAMRRILALGPVAAGIPIGAQLLYLVINSGCLTSWHGVAYVASANPFCALMLMWSIALYLAFLTLWGLLIYRPGR